VTKESGKVPLGSVVLRATEAYFGSQRAIYGGHEMLLAQYLLNVATGHQNDYTGLDDGQQNILATNDARCITKAVIEELDAASTFEPANERWASALTIVLPMDHLQFSCEVQPARKTRRKTGRKAVGKAARKTGRKGGRKGR
jgi:hypothetical protein